MFLSLDSLEEENFPQFSHVIAGCCAVIEMPFATLIRELSIAF